jgi:hypothetical protein
VVASITFSGSGEVMHVAYATQERKKKEREQNLAVQNTKKGKRRKQKLIREQRTRHTQQPRTHKDISLTDAHNSLSVRLSVCLSVCLSPHHAQGEERTMTDRLVQLLSTKGAVENSISVSLSVLTVCEGYVTVGSPTLLQVVLCGGDFVEMIMLYFCCLVVTSGGVRRDYLAFSSFALLLVGVCTFELVLS